MELANWNMQRAPIAVRGDTGLSWVCPRCSRSLDESSSTRAKPVFGTQEPAICPSTQQGVEVWVGAWSFGNATAAGKTPPAEHCCSASQTSPTCNRVGYRLLPLDCTVEYAREHDQAVEAYAALPLGFGGAATAGAPATFSGHCLLAFLPSLNASLAVSAAAGV